MKKEEKDKETFRKELAAALYPFCVSRMFSMIVGKKKDVIAEAVKLSYELADAFLLYKESNDSESQ